MRLTPRLDVKSVKSSLTLEHTAERIVVVGVERCHSASTSSLTNGYIPSTGLFSLLSSLTGPHLSGLLNELVIFDEHQGSPDGLQLVNMVMAPRITVAGTTY
jgi:hypothetical protein